MNPQRTALNSMYKAYDRSRFRKCRDCCNCQLREKNGKKKVCIAYGESVDWDISSDACVKMFNRPFLGLKPKYKTMEEQLRDKKKTVSVASEMQLSLF